MNEECSPEADSCLNECEDSSGTNQDSEIDMNEEKQEGQN